VTASPSRERCAIVTGATSGIGRAVAEGLAADGASVGLVARDPARGETARREITAATGNDRVRVLAGDLSIQSSVRDLGREAAIAFPRLDALVHCAAVYARRRSTTVDGLELMFATNVLGPFLLTGLLLPTLAGHDGRVLVLTAPSTVRFDLDDLQGERRFRSLTAFGATKAADLVFTIELARRVESSGVTANAVHPGLVRTGLMRDAAAPLRWATWLVSRSPSHAATPIVRLALRPDHAAESGRFFKDGRPIDPPSFTLDPELGRRLWEACDALSGSPAPAGAAR
jgi:NAD(P)-dependent dehydrogenase (short-subunit alcohol dehydrogenase family)